MGELVFLLILCSGGCFGAVCLGRRFEQMLPLTCGVCALWVFLFGLCGLLGVGPVLLLPAALALYGCCVWRLWKRRDFAGAAARLFTPGGVCFLLAALALLVLDRGMLFCGANSDEYGHWGLAVKEMLRLRDFSTSPLSIDQFAEYPPIVPCFQYILQRFLQLLGRTDLSEWHMFYALQLFSLAFLLPFLGRADWRRPGGVLLGAAALCAAPLAVFPTFYRSCYVDAFLAVVFAYVMGMALTERYRDPWDGLSLGVALSVLTLAKGSGLGFAGIGLLAALCMAAPDRQALRGCWRRLALLAAFVVVPKLLWSVHVAVRGCVSVHTATAGLGDYLRFLTLRDASGYRYGIVALFLRLLYGTAYYFELANHQIPYIYPLLGALLLNYLLLPGLKRRGVLGQRAARLLCPLLNLHMAVYVAGMLYVYLFRMPEYDAVGLSSMDRYLSTAIGSVWLLQVGLLVELLFRSDGFERSRLGFALVCVLLVLVPIADVLSFVSRGDVRDSQAYRAPYQALTQAVQEVSDPEDRVCIVSQDPFDRRIFTYTLMPQPTQFYCLGDSDWEGDHQTRMTCQELTRTLRDGFGYLILYQVDDYFTEHYADAFQDPAELHPQSLYRVDAQTGLLSLVRRIG